MVPIAFFRSCRLHIHQPFKLHASTLLFYFPNMPVLDRFLTQLETRLLSVSTGLLSMKGLKCNLRKFA